MKDLPWTRKETIERIFLSGPSGEVTEAEEKLSEEGYQITYCGPKRIGTLKFDRDSFEIVAERFCSGALR